MSRATVFLYLFYPRNGVLRTPSLTTAVVEVRRVKQDNVFGLPLRWENPI